jgi:NAD(P)-dependent dehydrogenase (short-subunit alcohol dehydrogenase family)
MSIFDLSGRAAVITGGNGGIGRGIAQALAAAGCNVSIWGRNTDKNSNAAATMAGCAGKVDTRVCDVSDPASVKAAMAVMLQTFGRVDGCFANAGMPRIPMRRFGEPRFCRTRKASLVRVLLIAQESFDSPCNPIARKTLPRPPQPTPRS